MTALILSGIDFPNHKQYSLQDIGMMVRVFANGPRDPDSIPGRVIPKSQKMVHDASLLNTAL